MIINSIVFIHIQKNLPFKLISIILLLIDITLILLCNFTSNKINLWDGLESMRKHSKVYYFFYSFCMILGYILVKCVLIFILSKYYNINNLNNFESSFVSKYINSGGLIGIIIICIQIVIVGPILEELVFRGILLKSLLKKYYNKPLKAILYSSIVFAIVHFNLIQGITAFGGAILLGFIYYYTKSIKICILLHLINNLLVIIPMPINLFWSLAYLVLGIYLINKGINNLIKIDEKNVDQKLEKI
ncbi:hypothetical protein GCM10008917_08490 [Paraclostridium tenue]|uniref:CAAX prenyl protease 2/Lysostaphin resistance protein A-like domain-containing protein n=1 Tax=Paraclostridium tenue TaxID=1737 RepID=A0ABN1M0R5_9FIRM